MITPCKKRICISLFAFAFFYCLIVGGSFLFLAWAIVHRQWQNITKWQAMNHWRETPAEILDVKLEHIRSNGRIPKVYYRIRGSYAYDFAGKRHVSSRITASGEFDDDPFQELRYQNLLEARRKGTRVTCKVNPDDPAQAVLFPDYPNQWYVTSFIFALGGIAIGSMGVYFPVKYVVQVIRKNSAKT